VLELLEAQRRPVTKLMIAADQDGSELLDRIEELCRARRIPVETVSRARLEREAGTESHQGVLAKARPLESLGLDELLAPQGASHPFLLVCDGITDPHNLGSLLRSAECAGVTGVVLPRHRSARVTPTVTKVAAGAIEYLRFSMVAGIPSALAELGQAGVEVVGLAGEARRSLYSLEASELPLALVVGSEEKGMAALSRKRCTQLVSIPHAGTVSSLNASVAGAVAIFEVARQRATRRR
jgi:23S rRNA (guanosine2251-2'-O)-methyltransferase